MKELENRIMTELMRDPKNERLALFVQCEFEHYKQRSMGVIQLNVTPHDVDLILVACNTITKLDLAKQWTPQYKDLRDRIEAQTGITIPHRELR